MLIMLSEGGETRLGTNVNFLLEEFGIALNNGRVTTPLRSPPQPLSLSFQTQ